MFLHGINHIVHVKQGCEQTHKLGCHRSSRIAQGRIVLHDTLLHEVVQLHTNMVRLSLSKGTTRCTHCKQIMALACPFEIPPAERQRAKGLVDVLQQRFGGRQA